MDRDNASALVRLLADAFLKRLEPGTIEIYTRAFEELNSTDLAFETVRELIEGAERFPAIATIRSSYLRKRNLQLDQEQHLSLSDGDGSDVREPIPKPVLDLLATMRARSAELNGGGVEALEEREGGECDDCETNVERRFVYGSFVICAGCAIKRMAAKEVT